MSNTATHTTKKITDRNGAVRESVQKRQGQESGGFLPLLLCFAVFGKTEYAVCCSAKRGHADRKKPPEGGFFGNILP